MSEVKKDFIEIKDENCIKVLRLNDITCVEQHLKNEDVEYVRFILNNGNTIIWRPNSKEELKKLDSFYKAD